MIHASLALSFDEENNQVKSDGYGHWFKNGTTQSVAPILVRA